MEKPRDIRRFLAFVAAIPLSCFAVLGMLFASLPQEAVAKGAQKRVELILDAEPKQFVALFDELAEHKQKVIGKLQDELDRKLTSKWMDDPLDPAWTDPNPSAVQSIEAAHGLIAERFAFCQTMPLEQFVEVAEAFRTSGYRPIRFRPYAHAD